MRGGGRGQARRTHVILPVAELDEAVPQVQQLLGHQVRPGALLLRLRRHPVLVPQEAQDGHALGQLGLALKRRLVNWRPTMRTVVDLTVDVVG